MAEPPFLAARLPRVLVLNRRDKNTDGSRTPIHRSARNGFHILVIIHLATRDEQAFSRDNRFIGGSRAPSIMDVKNRRWHGLPDSTVIPQQCHF